MYQPTAAVPPGEETAGRSDVVLVVTAWVAGVSAAASSYAALYELARATGWPWWTAWLFPLTVDAYAVAALRVWLSRGTWSLLVRRRARRGAVGAIFASVAGNAALHAALAHQYVITWPVVVAVAATPPIALGLVSHLFALRAMPPETEDSAAGRSETAEQLATPEVGPAVGHSARPKAITGQRQSPSKRAQLEQLLDDDPPAAAESNYAIAQRLAPGLGLNVQTASRYVRDWRSAGGAEVLDLGGRSRGAAS